MEFNKLVKYTEDETGGIEISYTEGGEFCSVKVDAVLKSEELRAMASLLTEIAEKLNPLKSAD